MILILGYGNPLRGDDGAGMAVCNALAGYALPGVEIRCCQQLTPELLEDFVSFETIVLIDACQDGVGREVSLLPVRDVPGVSQPLTHHLNAGVLRRLMDTLYGGNQTMLLCSVPGVSFDVQEGLSTTAQRHVEVAASTIIRYLQQGNTA